MNTVVTLQYAPLITVVVVVGAVTLIVGGVAIAWIALKRL